MTVATAQLSESLQTLIDSRLDTIDRMLLGRLSRQDRLAIVREVESQIEELLHERNPEELTREDVLAVLARLDPPEAYIPDELDEPRVARPRAVPMRTSTRAAVGESRTGRASGILGISAVGLVLLLPVIYMIALGLGSEAVLLILGGLTILLMVIGGIVGATLGIRARTSGTWAIVGIVTSVLALLLAVAFTTVIVAMLWL
jgi:hypothetical protein